MKKKKVLVLGGAGFIGFEVVKFLANNRNYDITVADIFEEGQKDDDFNKIITNLIIVQFFFFFFFFLF